MDFRDLTYIQAIAKHQNITKAADALYVGQPTLSKFLKSLETDLGQKLFRRLGNKYVPTYAGERYLEKAEQILQLKSDLDLELADIMKRDVGILKVAFPTMRCTYMLPATLPAFQRVYPNVKVDVREECSDNLDQMILGGEVEVAFYTEPVGSPDQLIECENLGEEELLICTGKDHPIGQFAVPNPSSPYPKLDVSLLKDELVIMMLPGQRTRQIVDKYLQDMGIQLNNVIYTSNLPAIMELVSMGYGVSFVFEPHLRHRVEARPISCYSFGEPRTTSHFVAAYRKGSYLPIYCRDFIEIARQTCGGT